MKYLSFCAFTIFLLTLIETSGQSFFTVNAKQYESIAPSEVADNGLTIGLQYDGGVIAAVTKDGNYGFLVSASDVCPYASELDNPESGNPNCPPVRWTEAKSHCTTEMGAKWRLPTQNELDAIRINLHNNGMAEIEKQEYWMLGQNRSYVIADGRVKNNQTTQKANTRAVYPFGKGDLDFTSDLIPEPVIDPPADNTADNTTTSGDSWFHLQEVEHGKCLVAGDVYDGNTYHQDPNGRMNAQWKIIPAEDGYFYIRDRKHSKDIVVGTVANNDVYHQEAKERYNAMWKIEEVGTNTYHITDRKHDMSLVAGDKADNNIYHQKPNDRLNAQWRIKLVEGSESIESILKPDNSSGNTDVISEATTINEYLSQKSTSMKKILLEGENLLERTTLQNSEGLYTCEPTKKELNFEMEDIPVTSDNVFYPGALVKIDKNMMTGNPRSITQLKRAPMKCIPSLPSAPSFTVTDPGNYSNVKDKIDSQLDNWLDNGYTNPANSFQKVVEYYSAEQLSFEFALDIDATQWSASTSANFKSEDTTKVYASMFKQVFYKVNVDLPSNPGDVFAATETIDNVKKYISEDDIPGYVSEVSYGRTILLFMKTISSTTSAEAKAAFSYMTGTKIDGSAEFEVEKIGKEFTFTAVVYGGSDQATGIASPEELEKMINNYTGFSRNNPGLPLSYKVNFLSSNQLAQLGLTTTVWVNECTFTPCEHYIKVQNSSAVNMRWIKVEYKENGIAKSRIIGDAQANGAGCGNLGPGQTWSIQFPCYVTDVKVTMQSAGAGSKTIGFGPIDTDTRCIQINSGAARWRRDDKTNECDCGIVRGGKVFKMGNDCK